MITREQRDQRNARARQRRLEERKQRVVDLLDKAAQTAWEFHEEPFWRELMFTIVSVSSVHDAVYSRRMVDAGVRAENVSPFVGAATLHFTRKDLDDRVQRSFKALRAERTAQPEESGVTLCADADVSAAAEE